MKIRHSLGFIHIDLSAAEARAFLEELAHVRGGTRLPKLRQVCAGLEASFSLAGSTTKSASAGKKRALSVVEE